MFMYTSFHVRCAGYGVDGNVEVITETGFLLWETGTTNGLRPVKANAKSIGMGRCYKCEEDGENNFAAKYVLLLLLLMISFYYKTFNEHTTRVQDHAYVLQLFCTLSYYIPGSKRGWINGVVSKGGRFFLKRGG